MNALLTTAPPLHTDNGAVHEDDGGVHKDNGAVRHNVLIFCAQKQKKKKIQKNFITKVNISNI